MPIENHTPEQDVPSLRLNELDSKEFTGTAKKLTISELPLPPEESDKEAYARYLTELQEYLIFENTHGAQEGFRLHPLATFESQAKLRALQIKEGGLKVLKGRDPETGELVATSTLVLKKRVPGDTRNVMGKEFDDENQAFASGTVVHEVHRKLGYGDQMANEQHHIAREAGKKEVVTVINKRNPSSIVVRMNKHGYRLVGAEPIKDDNPEPDDYRYRKNLFAQETISHEQIDVWRRKINDGEIKQITPNEEERASDREVLIDPEDGHLVQKVLSLGYEGVYLMRPKDFKENEKGIEKNIIVFTKVKLQNE